MVRARSMRTQADLVDQLFNSSEKRLARTLLLLAEFGKPGEPESLIPAITQETLAEMIGTTRSRVSFFMNRFRDHGFALRRVTSGPTQFNSESLGSAEWHRFCGKSRRLPSDTGG
jgi:CRP-like cAMP-binding protein